MFIQVNSTIRIFTAGVKNLKEKSPHGGACVIGAVAAGCSHHLLLSALRTGPFACRGASRVSCYPCTRALSY